MKLIFSEQAWEDYLYWQKTDTKILERINVLVKETLRQPFTGIGKPEPLKHALLVIGLDELMTSTDLFTKLQMTRFLLHNCDITTAHNAELRVGRNRRYAESSAGWGSPA